mmetsp:Transcript_51163/g.147659  ORF Transcript_51163/g.147659 Transcript_51163/m.147659 type:complete len:268 (+) Transcript_51163:100-903(+)
MLPRLHQRFLPRALQHHPLPQTHLPLEAAQSHGRHLLPHRGAPIRDLLLQALHGNGAASSEVLHCSRLRLGISGGIAQPLLEGLGARRRALAHGLGLALGARNELLPQLREAAAERGVLAAQLLATTAVFLGPLRRITAAGVLKTAKALLGIAQAAPEALLRGLRLILELGLGSLRAVPLVPHAVPHELLRRLGSTLGVMEALLRVPEALLHVLKALLEVLGATQQGLGVGVGLPQLRLCLRFCREQLLPERGVELRPQLLQATFRG